MKQFLRTVGLRFFCLGAAASSMLAQPSDAPRPGLLWQIGQPDHDDREFALAPNRYHEFRDDGFFVVGRSEAKRDWPYVQPGPHDAWAGGRPHTFSIVFGVKEAVVDGTCNLRIDLVDTQGKTPPELRVDVNGREFRKTMPTGAGDASVFGEPAKGKPHHFEIQFPTLLLRPGANEIAITTLSGSWILYDWLGLEAPPAVKLAEVSGTVVSSVRSAPALVEREGKLLQTIQLSIRHYGDETNAVVRVEGAAATPVTLRSAAQSFEVAVPAVEKEAPIKVSVEVGGKALSTQTVTLKPVRKWVVYLLPHSHVDIGYTHVQTDVERAQWKYLEMGMEAARKSATNPPGARFKWNVEVLWAVDSYLQQATPEKQQAFVDAVKAGQ
ncbi:MAG: polysaccharide lyase family protein, partial [Verrucomicrobia bacterium]|nr:polysaccharide lyase family protein [Verrucomicrobiota bacterium]